PRHSARQAQRRRRRHLDRPPVGHERRAHDGPHSDRRAPAQGQARGRHHVHRRRHGRRRALMSSTPSFRARTFGAPRNDGQREAPPWTCVSRPRNWHSATRCARSCARRCRPTSAASSSRADGSRRTTSSSGSAFSTPRAGRYRTGRLNGAAATGPPTQHYIFLEELQQAPAPPPPAFGVTMVGPVIIAFGSDAQKKRFLPRIANLDDWWCQGFSEPGSGSDLASLKTSAKRVNGNYVINGQKTWTTTAQYADWIFCLVRTDPAAKKQEGISFILIDMKTPGITVRPIVTIDGGREVNEVFFDDVNVPAENLVGQ